eukprot:759702-Amphidinium_carterae.1
MAVLLARSCPYLCGCMCVLAMHGTSCRMGVGVMPERRQMARLGADLLHTTDHIAVRKPNHYSIADKCFKEMAHHRLGLAVAHSGYSALDKS